MRERGLTKLEQLDFAALLRIADRNWFELAQAANLPREGRDWIRELQNVRNRWAHASTEQEAVEDTYRDTDTLARCLRMLGAGTELIATVETVKSTALREMAAAGGVRAASSEPAPAPTTPVPERPMQHRTDREGTVEVRDHVLWTKHIRGDDALKATLNALSERSPHRSGDRRLPGNLAEDGRWTRRAANARHQAARTSTAALARPVPGEAGTGGHGHACIRDARGGDGTGRTKLRGGVGSNPTDNHPWRHHQELEPPQRVQRERLHD